MIKMRKLLWLVIGAIAIIASSCEDFLDVSEYFDDTLKYDSVFTT